MLAHRKKRCGDLPREHAEVARPLDDVEIAHIAEHAVEDPLERAHRQALAPLFLHGGDAIVGRVISEQAEHAHRNGGVLLHIGVDEA